MPVAPEYPPSQTELFRYSTQLKPTESFYLDTDNPLRDAADTKSLIGFEGNLVAAINTAHDHTFYVVDARNKSKGDDFFYVADDSFSFADKRGYKGVHRNKPVVVGRSHHQDRFDLGENVSRSHFELIYTDQGLILKNLEPTNGTRVAANRLPIASRMQVSPLPRFLVHVGRTAGAHERVRKHAFFGEKDTSAPYGYYLNHPIIGRSSKTVANGIYLAVAKMPEQEAIIVDDKSSQIARAYTQTKRAVKLDKLAPTNQKLETVMKTIQHIMPYDADKVRSLQHYTKDDQVLGLSAFIEAGGGVCRHQALLAAYIMERLIDDKLLIAGTAAVERNWVPDLGGAHAWGIFKPKDSSRQPIVVDAAQGFVGTKRQAQDERRWEYLLDTDIDL